MDHHTRRRAHLGFRLSPHRGLAAKLVTGLVLGAALAACTSPTPTPSATGQASFAVPSRILLELSGNGVKESNTFTASGDSAALTYTFDCTSHGSAGRFALAFDDRTGLPLDTVNYTHAASGKSDQDSETIYLANTAAPYHLAIDSDCAWSVAVTGTP